MYSRVVPFAAALPLLLLAAPRARPLYCGNHALVPRALCTRRKLLLMARRHHFDASMAKAVPPEQPAAPSWRAPLAVGRLCLAALLLGRPRSTASITATTVAGTRQQVLDLDLCQQLGLVLAVSLRLPCLQC